MLRWFYWSGYYFNVEKLNLVYFSKELVEFYFEIVKIQFKKKSPVSPKLC